MSTIIIHSVSDFMDFIGLLITRRHYVKMVSEVSNSNAIPIKNESYSSSLDTFKQFSLHIRLSKPIERPNMNKKMLFEGS